MTPEPSETSKIAPKLLQGLQGISQWPPRTSLSSQGLPRRPKGAPRHLRRASIRVLAGAETIIFRQKSTLKRTSGHISRAGYPLNFNFGPAECAQRLKIRRIQRIHGVYEGLRSSTGSPGEVYLPLPLRRPNHCRRPDAPTAFGTSRMLLEPAACHSGKPENHRFRYYTSARAI